MKLAGGEVSVRSEGEQELLQRREFMTCEMLEA